LTEGVADVHCVHMENQHARKRRLHRERVAEDFNAWLAEKFEPLRNKTGTPKTSGGLVRYRIDDLNSLTKFFIWKFIGFDDIRKGEPCVLAKFQGVCQILELGEDEALAITFNKRYRTKIESAMISYRRSGKSPSGKPNRVWADAAEKQLRHMYRGIELDEESLSLRAEFIAMEGK